MSVEACPTPALGAVQIGMVQALYERGAAPHQIVGTSAGVVNGVLLGSRPGTAVTPDAPATTWRVHRHGRGKPHLVGHES